MHMQKDKLLMKPKSQELTSDNSSNHQHAWLKGIERQNEFSNIYIYIHTYVYSNADKNKFSHIRVCIRNTSCIYM